jgi:neuraminyllactose-binding hemagglutinin
LKVQAIVAVSAALLACGLLAACAPVSVDREVGQVNFSYATGAEERQTGLAIAIVAPRFVGDQGTQAAALDQRIVYTRTGAAVFSFGRTFQTNYRDRLAASMRDTLLEIVSRKGFATKGPYSSFDDMTYPDKKESYLACVPTVEFSIVDKRTKEECSGGVCTVEGVIQVTGEMNYKLVEPLTGQAVVNHRINLSDFNISRPYIHQQQVQAGGASAGALLANAISQAGAPSQLTDNTDKVLVDALNEFYAKSMAKVDQYISREELLSLRRDVDTLKGQKRY